MGPYSSSSFFSSFEILTLIVGMSYMMYYDVCDKSFARVGTVNSSVAGLVVASVISNSHVRERTHYTLGVRRMSLSRWDEGSDSDHVTGLNRDNYWLATVK